MVQHKSTFVTRWPNNRQTFERTEAQLTMTVWLRWVRRRISFVQCTPGTWWHHAQSSTHFRPGSHTVIQLFQS